MGASEKLTRPFSVLCISASKDMKIISIMQIA